MQANSQPANAPTSSDRRHTLHRRPATNQPPKPPYAGAAVMTSQNLTDDRIWLRFDDRQFAIGAIIRPAGLVPPQWEDLDQLGQFRKNRLYIVRAAAANRVPLASWNDPQRWCYQVDPERPLERDPDPTHLDLFDSWTCRTAIVRRILHQPS
jgi:hypothetical protein